LPLSPFLDNVFLAGMKFLTIKGVRIFANSYFIF